MYVTAGSWISRPFFGTRFKEGDEVKSHHFAVNTYAGVTFNKPEFKFNVGGKYEVWSTTGVTNHEYIKKEMYPNCCDDEVSKTFEEKLKSQFDWYLKNSKSRTGDILKEQNEKFAKTHNL